MEKIQDLLDGQERKQRKNKMEPGKDESQRDQSDFSAATRVGNGDAARLLAFTGAAGVWIPPSRGHSIISQGPNSFADSERRDTAEHIWRSVSY